MDISVGGRKSTDKTNTFIVQTLDVTYYNETMRCYSGLSALHQQFKPRKLLPVHFRFSRMKYVTFSFFTTRQNFYSEKNELLTHSV